MLWVNESVLTLSDMQTLSKNYKYDGVHNSISNSQQLFHWLI